MDYGNLIFRTILTYFVVLIVMRLMGKREIGKLSLFDIVVSIMIAEIAVIEIENTKGTFVDGFLPIFVLMLLQILISFISLKSKRIRKLVDGEPVIIVDNGEINEKEMRKSRYNMDDLFTQMRDNKINSLADVEFAVLEPSGKLNAFKKEGQDDVPTLDPGELQLKGLPTPLIIEGKVQDDNLARIGQTRFWLKNEIRKKGIKGFQDVFFATIDHRGNLFIDRKDR